MCSHYPGIVLHTFTVDADYKVGIHMWPCHGDEQTALQEVGSAEEFRTSYCCIQITLSMELTTCQMDR